MVGTGDESLLTSLHVVCSPKAILRYEPRTDRFVHAFEALFPKPRAAHLLASVVRGCHWQCQGGKRAQGKGGVTHGAPRGFCSWPAASITSRRLMQSSRCTRTPRRCRTLHALHSSRFCFAADAANTVDGIVSAHSAPNCMWAQTSSPDCAGMQELCLLTMQRIHAPRRQHSASIEDEMAALIVCHRTSVRRCSPDAICPPHAICCLPTPSRMAHAGSRLSIAP